MILNELIFLTVTAVEFSCTAGFPVQWTNLLVSQNVSKILFVLLLLVYLFIYRLDEMGIFPNRQRTTIKK